MDNITIINSSGSFSNEGLFDCADLTNNGLYLIFVGYLLPLLSPTMRIYLKDLVVHFKNCGKVTGQIVSLTEFGFTKIQKVNNNNEMVEFIGRLCKNKDLNVLPQQMIDCAWSFSGEGKNNVEGSWNKLLKEIDRLHSANILQRSNHRIKP